MGKRPRNVTHTLIAEIVGEIVHGYTIEKLVALQQQARLTRPYF